MTLDRLRTALSDRYRLEHELGAGGMATVYLAHDLKHERNVAIKVLHPDLGAALGPERFLTEIRTTAKLQHPHILPLLDSGEADGLLYYVMPLVTGETLRGRLERERQLPIADAVRIAREVASALDYAHRQGVIHRDIKPENILLHDGQALVADFGIALAVQSAGGARMTQTGLSLGTPQYMSPEQAMGEKQIDARSDVYALAAVTYEMLVGDAPFSGGSVQAIVAKIMTEKPTPVHTLRDTVPEHVEDAVLTGLAKLPADRFATAAEFAAALATGTGVTAARSVPTRGTSHSPRWWIAGCAVAAVVAFSAGRGLASGAQPFATLGRVIPVTWEQGLEITPALSPEGKQVAYAVGNGTASRIFVRATTDGRPTPLTGDSSAVEIHPRWSRDGARVLYIRDGEVFSSPASGGPPKQEVPSRGNPVNSATWSPDNTQIAYVVGDTVLVHGADGRSRVLATADQPTLCTWGVRDLIACSSGNVLFLTPGLGFGNIAPSWITVIRASDGVTTVVTDRTANNQSPQWSRDGKHLLYASNRLGPADLYAIRVRDDGSVDGTPERLTVGLNASTFSLSADDTRLAYAVMTTSANIWSEPWTEGGPRATAGQRQVTFGQQTIEQFSLSRDGRWLFFDSDLAGNSDLYRMSLATGIPERLTSDPTPEFAPSPSPDGQMVAFHSFRGLSREIYVLPLDGGALQQVTDTPDQEGVVSWSPDGSALVFFSLTGPAAVRIATHDAGGTWTLHPPRIPGYWPAWSPDSRWLSYTTGLLGGELRVVPVDSGPSRALLEDWGPEVPIAESSLWSEDGQTLYFKSHAADGAGSIWSIPSAGGTPSHVLDLGDSRRRSDRYGFRISGGRLYYTLLDRQSDVWLMELDR